MMISREVCGEDTDLCNSSLLTRNEGKCSNELLPIAAAPGCKLLIRSGNITLDVDFELRILPVVVGGGVFDSVERTRSKGAELILEVLVWTPHMDEGVVGELLRPRELLSSI